MHEASATVAFGEGQIYAALPVHMEMLFLYFESITPKSEWISLMVAPRLTLKTINRRSF